MEFYLNEKVIKAFETLIEKSEIDKNDGFVEWLHFTENFLEMTNAYYLLRYYFTEYEKEQIRNILNEYRSTLGGFTVRLSSLEQSPEKNNVFIINRDDVFDRFPDTTKIIEEAKKDRYHCDTQSFSIFYLERFFAAVKKLYGSRGIKDTSISITINQKKCPSIFRCEPSNLGALEFSLMPTK